MKTIKLLILLGVLWTGGLFYFFSQIEEQSPMNIPDSDAIIVLTGGKNRLEPAVKLLQEGKSDKLFITGVGKDVMDWELLERLGVDPWDEAKIEFGHEATDTFGNVAEAKKWIEDNNIKSLILVTANYHMPRAAKLFKSSFKDLEITEYPIISPAVELEGWLENEKVRGIIISEYNKYLISF